MALPLIANTLMTLEPALWLCALSAYLLTRSQSRFPMLGIFLGIKMASAFALAVIHFASLSAPQTYFYTYWISYFAGCIILFFALQELFSHAMAPLPGLSRLGIVCFRWAAAVSLVMALASIVTSLPLISQNISLSFICTEIATCLCVLELSLLVFLLACIYSLQRTYRSRTFGLCLGLGVMTATDMVLFPLRYSGVYVLFNHIAAFITVGALLVIVAYLVLPEPVRKPAPLSMASPLLRWNDLALQLGNSTETATGQNGFLQDVEGVVDRVLAKNSMHSTT
jgi:hypothetical protein